MTLIGVVPIDGRICSRCGNLRPEEAFRLRRRHGSERHTCCSECHNTSERNRRAARRSKAAARYLSKMNRDRDRRRASLLVNATLQQLGGLNAASLLLGETIMNLPPASKVDAMLRLMRVLAGTE